MQYFRTAKAIALTGAIAFALGIASFARAQETTTLAVALKDHRFVPAELTAPANKPVVIVVTNQDPTPAEFESKKIGRAHV